MMGLKCLKTYVKIHNDAKNPTFKRKCSKVILVKVVFTNVQAFF